jgi:hypothetical protein
LVDCAISLVVNDLPSFIARKTTALSAYSVVCDIKGGLPALNVLPKPYKNTREMCAFCEEMRLTSNYCSTKVDLDHKLHTITLCLRDWRRLFFRIQILAGTGF